MVRPKLNTFEHVRGGGGQSWRLVLYGDLPLNRQTRKTRLQTLPSSIIN